MALNKENIKKHLENQLFFEQFMYKAAIGNKISFMKLNNKDLPAFLKNINSTISKENSNKKTTLFYKIESNERDPGSFFICYNTEGIRFVSDNWTKDSIQKSAEMAAKLGYCNMRMIPLGQPGAFPKELRSYASKVYKEKGIAVYDPTPVKEFNETLECNNTFSM